MLEVDEYTFCFGCDDWSGIGMCLECEEYSCIVCGCDEQYH